MKILCIILLVLGAVINFIGPKVLKAKSEQQIDENKKVMVKSIGLLLVVIK